MSKTPIKKGPRRDPSYDEAAIDQRVAKHLNAVDAAPSPLAYALKTYEATFFGDEEDSVFKAMLAKELETRFPNANQLWRYIASYSSKVAHLM